MYEAGEKVFKSKKRIISGFEKTDTMRFIMGIFTSFYPETEFLTIFFIHKI
jgi:hypothetical protein